MTTVEASGSITSVERLSVIPGKLYRVTAEMKAQPELRQLSLSWLTEEPVSVDTYVHVTIKIGDTK